MVPYDVLVDPQSTPTNPILSKSTTMSDVTHEHSSDDEGDKESEEIVESDYLNEIESRTEKEVR